MAISGWLRGLAGVAVVAALLCNLPTQLWMSAEKATLQYLVDTSLQTVDEPQRQFNVSLLHFTWCKLKSVLDILLAQQGLLHNPLKWHARKRLDAVIISVISTVVF